MISIEYFKELINENFIFENDYLYKYIDLINNNLYNKKIKFKTQKHHIIPKSYYRLSNKKINNDSSNLVQLLHKDHILAHYYLALCSRGQFKYNNENCLYHILGNINYMQLPNYEEEKNFIIKLDKWQEVQEDLYTQRSKLYKGKCTHGPISDKHKEKISQKNKGNIYVKKFINNKWTLKKARSEEELYNYLNDGWIRGNLTLKEIPRMSENVSKAKKGKICVNKDNKNKYIDKNELDKYLNAGWQRGAHKSPRVVEKVKLIKFGKIIEKNKNKIQRYLDGGWQIYDDKQR